MNTQCPDCNGTGRVSTDRAWAPSARARELDTVVVREKCKTCSGHGWLTGPQIPA